MPKYPYKQLGTSFDRNYRNDLNQNFKDVETDVKETDSKLNSRITSVESNINQRATNYEKSVEKRLSDQDSQLVQFESDYKEANDFLDKRIDNIIAQTGDDTSEIVDMRLGADGVMRSVAGDLLREVHGQQLLQEQQTQTLTHGQNIIHSDQASPLKVEFYGNTLVNLISGSKWTNQNLVSGAPATAAHRILSDVKNIQGNYLLIGVEADYLALVSFYDSDGNWLGYSTYQKLGKIDVPSGAKTYRMLIRKGSADESISVSEINLIKPRLYSISLEIRDKIGVSLTDADVERMFPYVDSVQHVKNPVVKVVGKNLFNGELELGTLGATSGSESSDTTRTRSGFIRVLPNSSYTVKHYSGSTRTMILQYDKNKNFIQSNFADGDKFTIISTQSNTEYVRLRFDSDDTEAKVQFERGTEVTLYADYASSYLYAETTLAGLPNSNEKDILSYNEGLSRWEKMKWWEHVTLDGFISYGVHDDYVGFKRVEITPTLQGVAGSEATFTKYNGKYLTRTTSYDNGDLYLFNSNGKIYFTVSDTDSGWTESMTPTTDLIKSYFNGWKYTGDGDEHSWVSIVDEETEPDEQTAEYCADPANTPEGYKNYFLSYQLAKPVTEEVTVYGDLSISGDAQVEVSSGFDVIDNEDGTKDFELWTDRSKTANLTEVKATYQQSMKSSFNRVVEKQSDIATDVSVNIRAVAELYKRVKSLELTP